VKVVLDTNVLVSALVFPGGLPEQVYGLALEGEIDLVTSSPLLIELARVLAVKFGWARSRIDRALTQALRVAELVEPTATINEVRADPADNRVLEAAAEGKADVIVSGDRHLLRLKAWRSISIESPAAFIARLGEPA
jgi:putative PIN family toxin of toxin-antitoxin system